MEGRVRMRYRKTVTNPFFATPAGLELTAATDTGHNPAAAAQINYRVHPTTRIILDVTKKGGEYLGKFINTFGGRAGVEVNSDLVSLSASKHLQNGRIDYTALVGGGGWAGGLKGTIDTARRAEKHVDTKLALQYTDNGMQIGVIFSNDLDEYAAQFCAAVDPTMDVAGSLSHRGRKGSETEVGVRKLLDPFSQARAVVRSSGTVGAAYERLLGKNIDVKIGTEVDTGLSGEALFRNSFRRRPFTAGMQLRLHF